MPDLISRDAVNAEIEKINCVDYGAMDSYEAHSAVRDCLSDIQSLINEQPPVNAVPVHCGECDFGKTMVYTSMGCARIQT